MSGDHTTTWGDYEWLQSQADHDLDRYGRQSPKERAGDRPPARCHRCKSILAMADGVYIRELRVHCKQCAELYDAEYRAKAEANARAYHKRLIEQAHEEAINEDRRRG